jgi:hypothetical protein
MGVLRLVPVAGAAIEIEKDQAIVGREPSCDVFVNDGSVSRRHARLERRGAVWFVVDQGSANGTYLESQRVSDALLRSGQELRFGAIPFKVDLVEAPAEEGTLMVPADGTLLVPSQAPAPRPAAAYAPPPVPYAPPPPPPPPEPEPEVERTQFSAAFAPPPAPAAPPPPAPAPVAPVAPRPVVAAPPAAPEAPPLGEGRVRPPRGPRPPRSAVDSAPPPRRGRGAFFWIGLGCGSIVLLGLLLGGGCAAFLYYARKGPVDAARGQLALMRGGQLDQAYDRFSLPYKQRVSPEGLAAFVGRHPSLKENADSTFMSFQVVNDTANLAGYLTAAGGARETVTYELVKEGGEWKVSRLEVQADHPEAAAVTTAAPASGLRFDSVEASKSLSGEGNTVVRLAMSVSGFEVRPQGDQFLMDLTLDVETLDPLGQAVPALSREGVLKVQRPTSLGRGAVAPIETTLTLDSTMPPGDYTIVLRIHDDLGGQRAEQRATVTMP